VTVSLRLPVNTSNQDDFNRRVATAVNAILALVENNSMDAIEGIYKASPPTLTDGDQSEILLDSLGRLRVVQGGGVVGMEPSRATYVANFTGYAGYANMTDILRLSGSDTKTVAVTALWLIFQATAANNFTTNVDIIKRTAANWRHPRRYRPDPERQRGQRGNGSLRKLRRRALRLGNVDSAGRRRPAPRHQPQL
jgi:hypothetical protein